jgi:hypothetical protein
VFFLVTVLGLLPITLVKGFVTAYPPVSWLLLAHLGLGISVLGYHCWCSDSAQHPSLDRLPARTPHEHASGMAAAR